MFRCVKICVSTLLAMLVLSVPAQAEVATSYGPGLAGNPTTSGEIFDPSDFTAAHPWLPFGTLVLVCNVSNDECVVVRINDRGPAGADIDLSTAAAASIGGIEAGVFPITLTVL